MGLIELILVLAIIGFILWLVNTYIPMNSTIKTIINVVVVIVVVLWLINIFAPGLMHTRVPAVR